MSLTDLKKSKDTKVRKKAFTIDEFISDAEDYAKGKPKIVSGEQLNLEQAIILAKQLAEQQELKEKASADSKPKRHATFTLSEDAIDQLQLLAKETNLAKSHIIRILINELCNEEQHEKLTKLLKSDIG